MFAHTALYHEFAVLHVVVNALFTTFTLQWGFASSVPALAMRKTFASLPSVRVKSNPLMKVPLLFQALLEIINEIAEVKVPGVYKTPISVPGAVL